MVARGKLLAWAGESQYYTEPKRLARLGYLEARKGPGKTRERTVYTLTEKGREALRHWARQPARITPLKSEPLVRLLVADLAGERETRESLAGLREEIAELLERVDESEESAAGLPHRRKYLLLVTGFLRRYLELHLELADQVESELADGRRAT
jgi:DNA-binding PadR family transcriptional regulator